MNAELFHDDLETVIRQKLSSDYRIKKLARLTAGASAATWLVEVEAQRANQEFILRLEDGDEQFGTSVGKTIEAKTQAIAANAGAPVAKVLHIFDQHPTLGNGYLMEKLEGESLAPRILRQPAFETARQTLTQQCAQALATIHHITTEQLNFLPVQDAATQLHSLYKIHKEFNEPLPVFRLVFRWLKDNIPSNPQPRLVHGDFRLGNFLVNETGLNGVLDWELTHLGDPMEDLGWLCVRAWRFNHPENPVGGFGQRQQLYQSYEQYSGHKVNPQQVRYWELFGTLKWGVICQYQASTFVNGKVRNVERAAIGRRVAETEFDMIHLLDAILKEQSCL